MATPATKQNLIDYITTNFKWTTLGVEDWLASPLDTRLTDPVVPRVANLVAAEDWQGLLDLKTAQWTLINSDPTGGYLADQIVFWTNLGRFRTS